MNYQEQQIPHILQQFQLSYQELMKFLFESNFSTVFAYSDFLLPVLFVLSSINSFADLYRYYIAKEQSQQYNNIISKLIYHSDSPYLCCMSLGFMNRQQQLRLYCDYIKNTILLLPSYRIANGLQDLTYFAAQFEQIDYQQFRQLILDNSPFKSRRSVQNADFQKGVEEQLRLLFPGYEVNGVEATKQSTSEDNQHTNTNVVPPEIQIIVDFGKMIINNYDKEIDDGNQERLLLQLISCYRYIDVAQSLLPSLFTLQQYNAMITQLLSKQQTILYKIKSQTKRRSITTKNIYKTAYPAEAKQAVESIQQLFNDNISCIEQQLENDLRINEIKALFYKLLNTDLQQPLVVFLKFLTSLLYNIQQFNKNTPIKFNDHFLEVLQSQIVYFRRIELASWNSFFDDVEDEQVNIALVQWPDIYLQCYYFCQSTVQIQHQNQLQLYSNLNEYIKVSSYGQLHIKLQLLQIFSQIFQKIENSQIVIQILQQLLMQYNNYMIYVDQQVQQQKKVIIQEYQSQVKLFQWDESKFDLQRSELQVKKSHQSILLIIRKYSELMQSDISTIESLYWNQYILQYSLPTSVQNEPLQIIKLLINKKEKRNFLETELKQQISEINNTYQLGDINLNNFMQKCEEKGLFDSLLIKLDNTIQNAISSITDQQQQQELADLHANLSLICQIRRLISNQKYLLPEEHTLNVTIQEAILRTVKCLQYDYLSFSAHSVIDILQAHQLANLSFELSAIPQYIALPKLLEFCTQIIHILSSCFGVSIELQQLRQSCEDANKQLSMGKQFNLEIITQLFNSIITSLEKNYEPSMFIFITTEYNRLLQLCQQEIHLLKQHENDCAIMYSILSFDEIQQISMAYPQCAQKFQFAVPTTQALLSLYKNGFKGAVNQDEDQQQQQQKQQQLDGTGLGNDQGEQNINDQVKDEDLSDSQLLGNDQEQNNEQEQEASNNSSGIDMSREFDGQSQEISKDEENQEEQEEESLNRSLSSNQESNPDEQEKRDGQNSEYDSQQEVDQNNQIQQQQEMGSQSVEEEEQSEENNQDDVPEQPNIDYEQPDENEQFEDQASATDQNSSSGSEDSESVSSNPSFDDVLNDIFQQDEGKSEETQESEESSQEGENQQILQDENPLDQSEAEESQIEEESQQETESEQQQQQQQQQNINHNADQQENSDEENSTGFGGKAKQQDDTHKNAGNENNDESEGEDATDKENKQKQDKQTVLQQQQQKQLDQDKAYQSTSESANSSFAEDEEQKLATSTAKNKDLQVIEQQNTNIIMQQSEQNEDSKNDKANASFGEEIAENEESAENSQNLQELLDNQQKLTIQQLNQQSNQLASRLKAILQPTKSSQLQGDYRSGKRLNMKKIVGFVASNYRKDKIWLRRVKPEIREYDIIICVDGSMSVNEERRGVEIIESCNIIQNAVKIAEMGNVEVLKFGEHVEVVKVADNIVFDQKRTDFVQLLDYLLNNELKRQTYRQKLVLVLTDGIITEREQLLNKLVLMQQQCTTLFCLCNEAICDKQQVEFITDANGKRHVRRFSYLEQFPAPHYVVLKQGKVADGIGNALAQYLMGGL